MKKNYTFVILIIIMLYLLYNILNLKYETYLEEKIKEDLENQNKILYLENKKIKQKEIPYMKSEAYKDKLAKETSKYKNPWEDFLQVIEEQKYEKYRKGIEEAEEIKKPKEEKVYDSMTNFEKWIYFLFNKDIR